MSAARRRAFRSSSQGELGVVNHLRPIESPVGFSEIKKRPAPSATNVESREEKPRPRVTWTLGSTGIDDSQSDKKEVDDGYCEFLKACFLCKKKLKETADVYMYGYLQAFCSAECRDDQIALDGFDKEVSREPSKMAMDGMISTKGRQGFGTKRFK